MQWVASEQLKEAETVAHSRDMAIGLYRDLAVGANPGGAETWTDREAVVANLHVGAPPDILNATGQDWGLPPFDPRLLRKKQYAAFINLVRANMLHAGGLRIDHVMALQHLYLIPEGHPATEGAYVTYPLDDLVGELLRSKVSATDASWLARILEPCRRVSGSAWSGPPFCPTELYYSK